MNATLEFPARELAKLREGLEAELVRERRAAVRAINKGAAHVASTATRAIAAQKGIPARVIRERVKVRRANLQRVQARVWVGTYAVRVAELGALHQGKKGARAGRGKVIPGSFVATMASGHTGVFKRKGRPRLPIKEQTISLLPAAEIALNAAVAAGRRVIEREHKRLLALPNRRPRRIRR